jgi:hypothetical protein
MYETRKSFGYRIGPVRILDAARAAFRVCEGPVSCSDVFQQVKKVGDALGADRIATATAGAYVLFAIQGEMKTLGCEWPTDARSARSALTIAAVMHDQYDHGSIVNVIA